jgi:hypothetical protein
MALADEIPDEISGKFSDVEKGLCRQFVKKFLEQFLTMKFLWALMESLGGFRRNCGQRDF